MNTTPATDTFATFCGTCGGFITRGVCLGDCLGVGTTVTTDANGTPVVTNPLADAAPPPKGTWRVRSSSGRASRTAHVVVNGRALCGFRHFGTWADAHQWLSLIHI